jgi:hypothetical protein
MHNPKAAADLLLPHVLKQHRLTTQLQRQQPRVEQLPRCRVLGAADRYLLLLCYCAAGLQQLLHTLQRCCS